jgi:hypothetical protein
VHGEIIYEASSYMGSSGVGGSCGSSRPCVFPLMSTHHCLETVIGVVGLMFIEFLIMHALISCLDWDTPIVRFLHHIGVS